MIRRIPAVALLIGLGFTAACDSSSTDVESGPSTLSVYLTDAPGDVADVWVQVADIRLVGQGQPRSILVQPTGLISLLALQDTAMVIVDGADVDAGTYSQLRFVIDGGVVESVSGRVYSFGGAQHPGGLESTGELHCPSCAQSGLKVNFAQGLDLEAGDNAVLVDFDVAQSFGRQAGQSGRWVMRPVIQGVMTDPGNVRGPDSGISGEVILATDSEGTPIDVPPCAEQDRGVSDFIPLATSTTLVDEDGDHFVFAGSVLLDGTAAIDVLAADTYELGYVSTLVLDGFELHWNAQVTPLEIDVEAGSVTNGPQWTITGASCVSTD